jgi:hypothetical protein
LGINLETGIYLATHCFTAQRFLLNVKRSGRRLSFRDESPQKALSFHFREGDESSVMINQADFEARDRGRMMEFINEDTFVLSSPSCPAKSGSAGIGFMKALPCFTLGQLRIIF